MKDVVDQIRAAAMEEGFAACGIAPAVTSEGFHNLVRWLESGYAGTMDYIANRLDAYQHPDAVLAGAKSIIVLAKPYAAANRGSVPGDDVPGDDVPRDEESSEVFGKVARYTWSGLDYHDVIHPKLKRLVALIADQVPGANARGVVDTAPLMEREVAVLAGLGWRGKNTLLLNKHLGSYFFLACVLVDVELPIDQPHSTSHCGTCTACLDACPTDAFPQAGVLDASKCISYLTIENRGLPEHDLRNGIGDWAFGCDVCQEVCPWNRRPARRQTESLPAQGWLELTSLWTMTETEFRDKFRRTAYWRTRRTGMLRNAAIVMGNQGDRSAIDWLFGVLGEPDPVVRAAAVWAIRQLDGSNADERLAAFQCSETEPMVLAEFEL